MDDGALDACRMRVFDQVPGALQIASPQLLIQAGRQYVAVTTGASLVANSSGRLTPELRPANTANVFVFALP